MDTKASQNQRKIIELKPQPGFQQQFLSSKADIVIGGGSAGVGKTFAELLEPLRNKDNPKFGALFFRRSIPQIKNIGGLWDESNALYPYFKAKSNSSELFWKFPSGATVKFSHLQEEKTVYEYQGSQIPCIIFDELTHFTKKQFFYLLGRNRSMCGIKPYVRATCNPDPDSFVAELIDWWIDQESGFPILERSGKLRYFMMDKDNYIWGNTVNEVYEKAKYILDTPELREFKKEDLIKSLTFIPGSIYQNKKLLEKNPGYLANLLSLEDEEKDRLLFGNWKIRTDGLSLFHYDACLNIFTNNFETIDKGRYITCDAARFGSDFCVIMVWEGYKIIKCVVIRKSDTHDIVEAIEKERKKFTIPKSNIAIDADGVGEAAGKLGKYLLFYNGSSALWDPTTKKKGLFKNLKTQCYYKLAELVNNNELSAELNNETVIIDDIYGMKIKAGGKLTDVRQLIIDDLKAVKRKDPDKDNRKQINDKDEQKVILNGRSPDFGDCMMFRIIFDLMKRRVGIQW